MCEFCNHNDPNKKEYWIEWIHGLEERLEHFRNEVSLYEKALDSARKDFRVKLRNGEFKDV